MSELTPVIFGEVLLDLFPDGKSILGGAPFNIAWHLQGFGLCPLLISRIGDDKFGNEIIDVMNSWGMDLSGVQIDEIHPTGRVNVSIKNNEPSYDIQENCAYDFIERRSIVALPEPCLFYYGTLASRYRHNQALLQHLKKKISNNKSSALFVDVNLRPPWYELENMPPLLMNADYLKLNVAELEELLADQFMHDVNQDALHLKKQLEVSNIVITQGAAGAMMIDQNDGYHDVQPDSGGDLIDTVGAGDAFSSVLILGELKKWDAKTSLTRAQQFATEIVNQQGATKNNLPLYQYFKDTWTL